MGAAIFVCDVLQCGHVTGASKMGQVKQVKDNTKDMTSLNNIKCVYTIVIYIEISSGKHKSPRPYNNLTMLVCYGVKLRPGPISLG